jgi:hypothetical protein
MPAFKKITGSGDNSDFNKRPKVRRVKRLLAKI